jgi:type II secretory pathway pseudopilin PulG
MNQKYLFKKHKNFSTKGFTLIEALVSAFIVSSIVLGPLTIALDASANAKMTKDTITAGYLAQEGVELLRSLQDSIYLKCSQGETLCVLGVNETTSDAAWRIFKGYLGYGTRSISTSCYLIDGEGCTYDFYAITEHLGDTVDASPALYNIYDTPCSLLALGSDGIYACMGVRGSGPGYKPGKYKRVVTVQSITTIPGPDSSLNDDLRVVSSITFVRPFGTTKTVTVVDFLHARS